MAQYPYVINSKRQGAWIQPKTQTNYPYTAYMKEARGTRSKPIVRKPYAYTMKTQSVGQVVGGKLTSGWLTPQFVSPVNSVFDRWTTGFKTDMSLIYNRAYSKFVSDLSSPQAAIGTMVAEWKQGSEMVLTMASRLITGYRMLRRGRFRAFTEHFGIRPKRKDRGKRWTRPKQAGNIWLEYWFAWAPTVADIHTAVEELTQPKAFKKGEPTPCRGVSGGKLYRRENFDTSTKYRRKYLETNATHIVSIQANMVLRNPDAVQLARLGLLNPVSIAWEVTPFSFLVDWFGNVGDVINSYTDFVGWEQRDAFMTTYTAGTFDFWGYECVRDNPAERAMGTFKIPSSAAMMSRTPGISRPSLVFSVPKRLSTTRAATAMALLVGVFGNKLK